MPHYLINQIKTLQNTDLGQETSLDTELTGTTLDLSDRGFDMIDKIVNTAQCLFAPSFVPSQRQIALMAGAGFTLTHTVSPKPILKIQTPKGYLVL